MYEQRLEINIACIWSFDLVNKTNFLDWFKSKFFTVATVSVQKPYNLAILY